MGERIVVLHGWGKGVEKWQGFKKELEKKGWHVFLPELPGFGKTAPPVKPWNVSDYADWLKPQLSGKYWLAGHSFGGRIAIKLASQRPKNLLGLILINSAGIKPRFSFKQTIFFFLAKTGKAVFCVPPFCLLQSLARRFLYRLAGARDYYQAKGTMKKSLQKVTAENLTPFLKKIKIQTLILWGEQDKETPLSNGKLMSRLIPNSELKIFRQAGHFLPLKQSPLVAAAITEFSEKQL